jgi:hypothetical protein
MLVAPILEKRLRTRQALAVLVTAHDPGEDQHALSVGVTAR